MKDVDFWKYALKHLKDEKVQLCFKPNKFSLRGLRALKNSGLQCSKQAVGAVAKELKKKKPNALYCCLNVHSWENVSDQDLNRIIGCCRSIHGHSSEFLHFSDDRKERINAGKNISNRILHYKDWETVGEWGYRCAIEVTCNDFGAIVFVLTVSHKDRSSQVEDMIVQLDSVTRKLTNSYTRTVNECVYLPKVVEIVLEVIEARENNRTV